MTKLIREIVAMRNSGYTYREINRTLGLLTGTRSSSYRLLRWAKKHWNVKAVADCR